MYQRFLLRSGATAFSTIVVACLLTSAAPVLAQSCGDGRVDLGEQCDESPSLGRCTATCTIVTCADTLDCDRLPSGDTRIEVGEEAALDHGREDDIEADGEKRAIAYLKFDLSDITGRVSRATLHVFCTDDSPDGGTIFPVSDSSWIEGTGEAEPGPGLRWIDVDADADGAVGETERSRYAPDFTRPIASFPSCDDDDTRMPPLIVTKAFQNGPGIYSLAIVSDHPNSVKYASREAKEPDERPVLELEFAYTCGNLRIDPGEDCEDANFLDGDGCDSNCTATACGNGIVTAGEDCDDGSGNCTAPCCGNGLVEGTEACDDGGASATCDADCTSAICGDGTRNAAAGEGCDDGNTVAGDGCKANCTANCCNSQNFAGCDASICESCVCSVDSFCCSPAGLWDDRCVRLARTACDGACRCAACSGDTECIVQPVADTYVEGPNLSDECAVNDCPTCGEATWDHGGRARLEVGGNSNRRMAYLKFDLRGLKNPIVEANLRLFATQARDPEPIPNGGDIYPLPDSSWLEGDCDGVDGNCACDPGDGTCACDPGDGSCFAACKACVDVVCEAEGDPVSCRPLGQCVDPGGIAACENQAALCDAIECLVDGVPTLCQPDLDDDDAQEAMTECLDEGEDTQTCTIKGLEEILQCEVCEDLMPCSNPEVAPCSQQRALTFTDVDTNGNGQIDAADGSPFLPDFSQPPLARLGSVTPGQPRTVDVTAAFEGSNPDLYSLVISQTESEERAQYEAREDVDPDQAPLLTLKLGCTTDSDCDTVQSCVPRRCIDGRCTDQPRPAEVCEVCRIASDCEDGNPCTINSCDTEHLENGCVLGDEPVGVESVTCALGRFQPAACRADFLETSSGKSRKLDKDFACKLDREKVRLCKRLATPCRLANQTGAEPTKRRARRAINRVLAKLRQMKRDIVLKAGGLDGKPVSQSCGRLLAGRIDLARDKLLSLKRATKEPKEASAALACATVTQTMCEAPSEVCD